MKLRETIYKTHVGFLKGVFGGAIILGSIVIIYLVVYAITLVLPETNLIIDLAITSFSLFILLSIVILTFGFMGDTFDKRNDTNNKE